LGPLGLGFTGAVILLEPVSGVTSFLSRVAALGAYGVADTNLRRLSDRVSTIEQRLRALHDLNVPTVTLTRDATWLLTLCIQAACFKLYASVDPEEAIPSLNMTPQRFADAVEDLKDSGFVKATGALASHRYSHVFVTGTGYVAAAPTLVPEVDVPGDLRLLLSELRKITPERYRLVTTDIQTNTGIPHPRLDLLLEALTEQGLVERQGPGDMAVRYLTVSLTPAGRRRLRLTAE
jgi:hypothetical protein